MKQFFKTKNAKQVVAEFARDLMRDIEAGAAQSVFVQDRLDGELFALELLSVKMGWEDIDEEITAWRAKRGPK